MNKICLIFLFLAAVLTFSVAEEEGQEKSSHEDGMKNRDRRSADGRKDRIRKERKGVKETKSKVNVRKESKRRNKKQRKQGKPKRKGNKKGKRKGSKNRNKTSKKGTRKWNKKGTRKVKINENNKESRKRKQKENGHTKIKHKIKKAKYNSKTGHGHSSGRQTCSVSTTCFEKAVNFMKIWKDNVKNFEQQLNRMIRQNKTGGLKSGKKGLFAPVVQRLIEAGGGNRSNLSCNGNYENDGAKQMANLTNILNDCQLKINASCNPANFPQPNMTLLTECSKLVTTFKGLAADCLNRTTVSAACECWTDSALEKAAIALKECKIADASKAITKQFIMCTGNFSICRKFEDDTITAIMACRLSTAKLLAKAKALTSNKNEMTKAKDKMSSLSGSSFFRQGRATAAKCSEIITKSKQITTLASDSPNSASITKLSAEISSASVTCSSTEQTSLKAEVTSMTSSIAIISVALETVQTNLKTITGTTASTAAIDAAFDDSSSATTPDALPAKASTAKNSGRRSMLVRDTLKIVYKRQT